MPTDSVRVLIVDDSEPWRRFLRSTLEGHPNLQIIREVSDGLEAVQQAQELQPDLILLDIGLPSLNGIEVAWRIRRLLPKSKILFVSQESSADIVQEALSTGEAYVVKVDAMRELLTAINAVARGERFVGGRFAGQGLAEAAARVREGVSFGSVGRNAQIARHDVAFYSEDRRFVDDLAQFIERALKAGNAAIVVANESHRKSLLLRLQADGLDIAAITEQGRYVALDAAATLSTFMLNNLPDPARLLKGFRDLILAAAKTVRGDQPRVVACGEMGPLLWARGNAEAAIQVEKLTNDVVNQYGVDILCEYPLGSFPRGMGSRMFQRVCAEHTFVGLR